MPKTKDQKREILKSLVDKINQSKSIVFARFNGLPVKDNEELRKELKKEDSEYFVAKKTLFDLAFKDSLSADKVGKIENLDIKNFEGKIAVVFGYKDEVAPARVVDGFIKKFEGKLEFVGGILEQKFLKAEDVAQLAKIPSKQELYAKMVGSMQAPVSGFVNVLAGNIRNFVQVLKAIEEKK